MTQTRKLAAIMFTDIAGYTALMGRSEQKALEVVAIIQRVQRELVKEYGGTWHKDLGDGSLCSFDSTVQAVQCAIAIQQALHKQADFKLRIGIHLGDVTFDNGDVFGDGVNVAARIQAEAAEGGICLSEAVHNSIKSRDDIQSRRLGKRRLKNVKDTVRLYQVKAPGVNSRERTKMPTFLRLLPVLVAVAAISSIITWTLHPRPDKEVVRFSIPLPEDVSGIVDLAISSDGKVIAYAANTVQSDYSQIFFRRIDQYASSLLDEEYPYTGGLAFSPDNALLSFFSNDGLRAFDLESGITSYIGPALSFQANGASWMGDQLVYAPGVGNFQEVGGLLTFGAGAENAVLIEPDSTRGEWDLAGPKYLPEYGKILYQAALPEGHEIRMLDVKTRTSITLLKGVFPAYLPTGHLLFKDGTNLMGIPFDPEEPSIIGDRVRIGSAAHRLFAASDNGTMVYVEPFESLREPVIVRSDGQVSRPAMPPLQTTSNPSWSPDQSMVLYRNPSTRSLWLYDVQREINQMLIRHDSNTAIWFPDGQSVAYQAGLGKIERVSILDPTHIDTLVLDDAIVYPTSFSSDGSWMFYDEISTMENKNIWLLNLRDGSTQPFLKTSYTEQVAMFSPDDQWVAYCSNESGRDEIFVRAFPDTGRKWVISKDGGTEPRWSKNGQSLYYRKDNKILRVPILSDQPFDFGNAEQVLEGPYPPSVYQVTNYDVSRDGQTFLMLQNKRPENLEIKVVLNWFEELEALMESE